MKTENRQNFENDLENFNKRIINRIKSGFHYSSFDLICASRFAIKKLIGYFNSNIKKFIYVTDKQIYAYANHGRKNVIGLSLDEIRYLGVSPEKVIERLRKNPNCVVIDDDSFLNHETKAFFPNISIYIPYLYFLKTL